MKKILLINAVVLMAAASHGQGTVNFRSFAPALGVNFTVSFCQGGLRLQGPRFKAVLLAGPNELSLQPIATTDFLTGAGAGYFIGGIVEIPTVPPGGKAFVEIGAFDSDTGAEIDSATLKGFSVLIAPTTGGDTKGGTIPPSLPAELIGMPSFCIGIPDPSTFPLAVMALAAWLLRQAIVMSNSKW